MPIFLILDIVSIVITMIVSSSLLLIAVSAGIKQLKNLAFFVYCSIFVGWAIATLLLRFALWYEVGNPLVLAKMVGVFFTFVAPASFLLASQSTDSSSSTRIVVGISGIAASAGVSIPLLLGGLISNPRMVSNGSTIVDVSAQAWLYGIIPIGFFIATLIHYWNNRQSIREQYSGLATLMVLVGVFVDGLLEAPIPLLSFCAVIAICILGYGVLSRQLLNPLKESEANFRNLAEESPNIIFINSGGRVLYVNRVSEDEIGYSREEIYRDDFDFFNLIAPDSIELVKSNLREHTAGRDVPPYECGLIRRDGRRIDSILTTRLIDFSGDRAILGIITDITRHSRTERMLLSLNKLAIDLTRANTTEELGEAITEAAHALHI